jgi:general secretion pathway protein K
MSVRQPHHTFLGHACDLTLKGMLMPYGISATLDSRTRPSPAQRPMAKQSEGFALIAVLGLLMVLSLVAAFIADYAEQRMEQTFQLRQQLQNRLNSDATIATLLHVIATRPLIQNAYLLPPPPETPTMDDPFSRALPDLDINQFSHLTVEGQMYQGVGDSAFTLQDEASLLSLIDPDRGRWTQLFMQNGLTTQQAERFLDQLQDYTDQDDVRRLNGATSSDYINQGLQPPPQRLMISPGQVFNLLDGQALQKQLLNILPLITARSGQLHNINTAPTAVLRTIPGVDQQLAEALVQERRNRPFTDLSDANLRLGRIIPLDALDMPSQASSYLRIAIWADASNCRQSIWLGLSSTPTSRLAPWEIDYFFTHTHEQPCLTPQQVAFPPLFEPPVDG